MPVRTRPRRVLDEGVLLGGARELDFVGGGVTATLSGGRATVTVPEGSGLPVFNVRAAPYSAAGNGTTDDTAAIQAAIDDASAASYYATVFLPFGYYKITAPLVITRPIRLLGEGCVVGDRLKNSNYAAKGAVIWNASTSQDAIQFTPEVVSGLWPRGLGGMIFQDFGIDTPELGGAAVTTTDPAGWGPHSTGKGIAIAGTTGHYGYYVKLTRVTVCRHYWGFDLNTGSASSAYNTGSIDLEWCNALLCKTGGYNAASVEARMSYCRAKNNDPEWGDSQVGTYGFLLGADGGFYNNCIAISCQYGYYCGAGNGFHNLIGCGADSCPYPFIMTSTGSAYPSTLVGCWGVPVTYTPPGTYIASNQAAFDITNGVLNGCYSKQGFVTATDAVVSGGQFAGAKVYGTSLLSGVRVEAALFGGLLRGSGFTGSIVGCDLTAGLSGSAGSSKGRGNLGQADWG